MPAASRRRSTLSENNFRASLIQPRDETFARLFFFYPIPWNFNER
jgi:hypothetical protein